MKVDVLIPTYRRPAGLAVTLTSLTSQDFRDFRIVLSDQTEDEDLARVPEVQAALRVLRLHGHAIDFHKHLPRRGMAEQRQFLLDQVDAPYALFLDDDVILERDVIRRMLETIERERCGFVGCPLIGLSHIDDVREADHAIEFWEGPVAPEELRPGTPAWERYRLHNAANMLHLQQRLGITPEQQRTYRVAWVGGCVLYDTQKLRAAGGFCFWRDLPETHAGEDVLAQVRVMAQFGGCGLIPSGVYHLELPTTIPDRTVDAPYALL